MKAKYDLLRKEGYKTLTIKEMVPKYAPASAGNDVPGYTKDIGTFSGLNLNRRLDSLNDEEYGRLLKAIARREGAIDKHGNQLGVGTVIPGLSTIRPEPRPEPDQDGQSKPVEPAPGPVPAPNPEPPPVPPSPKPEPQSAPAPAPEPPKPEPATEPLKPAPVPQPAPQPAPASEQKQSEALATPQAAAMVSLAAAPVAEPGRAALLKPVERWTESEMKDVINTAQGGFTGWCSGDPLKDHMYERVQDWHVNIYGDDPQANDGGKPIEPKPLVAIPQQPAPHTTPEGEDLWQASGRMGGKVAEVAGSDGLDTAVVGLQRGLNMLAQANPLPKRSPAYGPYTPQGGIDEDGKYGPQTDFAMKQALSRLGPAKLEEAFALGRFNSFARQAQRNGNPEGVADATHTIFAPLLRSGDGAKVEAGLLQETLNGFGAGRDDWQDLKVDDWIGPKTTEAFKSVLQNEDADRVTAAFGRRLGFL